MKPGDKVYVKEAGGWVATIKSIDGRRAIVWWSCPEYGRHEMDVPVKLVEYIGPGEIRYPVRIGKKNYKVPTHSNFVMPAHLMPRNDNLIE